MNLKDGKGFTTIGYEHMEDEYTESQIPQEATADSPELHPAANEDNEKENMDVAEPKGQGDGDTGAVVDSQGQEQRSAVKGMNSRAESIEGLDPGDDEGVLLATTEFVQSTAWAPQGSEQSINELHDYFSRFYSIRRIVKQTYQEFQGACQDIQELLASGFDADRGADAWLSASEEQTIRSVLQTDPVLIVLGCKGSGKSSVINGILGQDILPSSSAMLKHACNGIVHLKYDEVGYTRIARTTCERRLEQPMTDQQDGQQQPRPAHQVRAFIEEVMNDEDRTAWGSLDNCILEIGVRNPILRTRVQFLEIPGDCFDPRLRERLLKQLIVRNHQTVMYVIDGNKGLGNSDREFLFFLKANIPNIRIFFIVNKVDYDPEAEEMDCESDNEDFDSASERYHESGAQTQKRKQRLVIDQLEKYKLACSPSGCGCRQSVFPVSVLRQKCPLEGSSEQIQRFNQEYKSHYQTMVTALKDCLVETGRSRMELALSTLFLVAARTFDAFTRDPGDEAGEGVRQAEQASKERIQQSFRQTREKFKECRANFLTELETIHKEKEEVIIGACQRLEFGPLRLYNRIRNNEVEQQYREQINNYVLHLLNVEIKESLERQIASLKTNLFQEVEKLKLLFSNESKDRPSSPWDDLIRTHADEIITGVVKLNFSIEWKAEAGFLKWVKKLWSGATVSKAKAISPNTPEWKSEVAKEFYKSIDLNAVVRKMFSGVEWTIKQAESDLLNLAYSRHKFAAKLQKMLGKGDKAAKSAWHRVQFCLVSAEALRNLQMHGPLASSCVSEPVAVTCLGRLCHLTGAYAGFGPTQESNVAVTVTDLCSSSGGTIEAEAGATGWVSRLGGIPNHHLVKGQHLQSNRCVAITLMVTFTDRYELSVLHSAYRCSMKDFIDGTNCGRYTKLQCFQTIRDLMQIWKLLSEERGALQWSLKLQRLKVSTTDNATVVYDYLEGPLPALKKGHAIANLLFAKSEAEVLSEKLADELDNLLQVTFMLLLRDSRGFKPEELARIEERELPDERYREFRKYLTALVGSAPGGREMDPLPADTIANLWYTKQDRKVKDIDEWIARSLLKAQQK